MRCTPPIRASGSSGRSSVLRVAEAAPREAAERPARPEHLRGHEHQRHGDEPARSPSARPTRRTIRTTPSRAPALRRARPTAGTRTVRSTRSADRRTPAPKTSPTRNPDRPRAPRSARAMGPAPRTRASRCRPEGRRRRGRPRREALRRGASGGARRSGSQGSGTTTRSPGRSSSSCPQAGSCASRGSSYGR